MEDHTIIEWENHNKLIRITSINIINLHDFTITGTRFTYLGIHGQLQST